MTLHPLSENGWRNGFSSLLHKENQSWSSRWRWLVQSIIWLGIINGFIALILIFAPPLSRAKAASGTPSAQAFGLFFTLLIQIGSIGVVILAHDQILGEKQTGTAAWILSKPVSRVAFILSKLVSSGLRILIFIILLPGLVAVGEISFATGHSLTILPFVSGIVIALSALLFYLTLALMLSTFLEQRSVILAIAFGIIFGLPIVVSFVPEIAVISPFNLPNVASALALGQTLTTEAVLPIIFTVLWNVLFISLTMWRFGREEF